MDLLLLCQFWIAGFFLSLTGFRIGGLALTFLPLGLLALVVGASPRMAPRLARHVALVGQERGQRHLQLVRLAANGVAGVAVVAALACPKQNKNMKQTSSMNDYELAR